MLCGMEAHLLLVKAYLVILNLSGLLWERRAKMVQCEKCGFPLTEIIGVYREEPKHEDRKVCLNCLRKDVEKLKAKLNDLEHGYYLPKRK